MSIDKHIEVDFAAYILGPADAKGQPGADRSDASFWGLWGAMDPDGSGQPIAISLKRHPEEIGAELAKQWPGKPLPIVYKDASTSAPAQASLDALDGLLVEIISDDLDEEEEATGETIESFDGHDLDALRGGILG